MRAGSVVRAVALALPFAATACVLALLVGPGRERPIPSARVHATGTGPWRAVRIEATTERANVSEARRASLEVTRGDGTSVGVQTSERGTAELGFDPPLHAGERLRVVEGASVLFEGPVEEGRSDSVFVGDRWSFSAPSVRGLPELVARARLRHGVLAPPFPATLEVTTTRAGQPVDAEVAFTTVSAEPERGSARSGAEGVAKIELVPLGVPVRLTLEVTHEGDVARKSADLPGQMGAIVPTLEGAALTLTSPSPRAVAYFSIFDEGGRSKGGEVPLVADPDDFFRGRVSDLELAARAVVVVTPHAVEDVSRAYAWRTRDEVGFCAASAPALGCSPVPELLRVAADGGPKNRETEKARVADVRGTTKLLLSVALACEIALVLLLARSRCSSAAGVGLRVGEDGLPEAPSPTDDPEYALRKVSPWSQPAFVVVLVLVAVMFALWAWLMTP